MNRDDMTAEEWAEWEEGFEARAEARAEWWEAMREARQDREGERITRLREDHPNLELERRNK